jgi:hypothetical protein
MKKIIILTLSLLTTPSFAGLNCMDNSEHLQYGDYDNKEWHSVECCCPCTYIKGRKCVECGHLQKARPWTIVQPGATKTVLNKVQGPQRMHEAFNNLVRKYVQNKE